MKTTILPLILACLLPWFTRGQEPPATVRLSGLVKVAEMKWASLEVLTSRPVSREFILGEGERLAEVEVRHIDEHQGIVDVSVAGEPRSLHFTSRAGLAAPGMVLEDAPLDTVLSCYRQFTHRTLLSSGALPKIRLTLQAAATNDVTAAKVLEKALADQGILSFPYGAKFLLVLAASEAETARARLPLTNSLPVSNGLESVPAGMLKLQKADFSQALALYANFVGRRWQGNSPRGIQVAPIDVFAQTELTASEAGTALEILFALRGVKVVPVGVDGLKVVALETTLNR